MCRGDWADGCVTLSERFQRARRPYRCGECPRTIEPGEEYESTFLLVEGDPRTERTCLRCVAARRWLLVICRSWIYGEVREDLEEHLAEGYYTTALVRLTRAMRYGWRSLPLERVRALVDEALEPIPEAHRGGVAVGA